MNAASGNTISSANQVASGVITTTGILDGTIANVDISASAAIAGSKIQTLSVGANAGVIASTGIVNADIASGAAIADSKLAQITTAGKVSGAALTLLGSVPSGAGVLPAANSSPPTFKSGTTTKDASDASTTQTIAHGLGRTPNFVRITASVAYTLGGQIWWGQSIATYNGTTQSNQSNYAANGGADICDNSFSLNQNNGNGTQVGVITVDGTNITITWTKTGIPVGTYQILWEVV